MIGARRALAFIGLLLVVGSFFVPTQSAGFDGGRTLQGFAVLSLGVACVASAAAFRFLGSGAALWAGTWILLVASELALTKPLWLQYVKLRAHDIANPIALLAIAILVIDACVVVPKVWRIRRNLREGVARHLRGHHVLILGLLFLFSAAHLTLIWGHRTELRFWVFYGAQLVVTMVFVLIALAHLVILVSAADSEKIVHIRDQLSGALTLPGKSGTATRADRRLPFLLAAFAFCVALFQGYGVFDATTHIQDEVSYLFQARCYADLRLEVPPPPPGTERAFGYYLLQIDKGRWYGAMNPGWPLLLGVFVKLGIPWFLNPLLAALSVFLGHALVRRIADLGTAHLVSLLLAASPWFLLISGSLMAQTLSLVLTLGAWLCVLKARSESSTWPALVAGLLLGFQFLVRPMDALIVGGTLGLFVVVFREHRLHFRAWVALILGGLATAVWTFPLNAHFTGNPLHFTISHYFDQLWYPGADRLGFGPDVGNPTPRRWVPLDPEPGHGAIDVLLNSNQNIYNSNFELHGWPMGSLLLPALFWMFGKPQRLDRAFLAFIAVVIAGYSTYWFSGGPDFGARYWFLTLFPLLIFAAKGYLSVEHFGTATLKLPAFSPRLATAVFVLILTTWSVFLPWRMIAKYPDYRTAYADIPRLYKSGELGQGLIFVRSESEPEYGPVLLLNRFPLDPKGPIFARDLDEKTTDQVRAAFPDLPAVRVLSRTSNAGETQIQERLPAWNRR